MKRNSALMTEMEHGARLLRVRVRKIQHKMWTSCSWRAATALRLFRLVRLEMSRMRRGLAPMMKY